MGFFFGESIEAPRQEQVETPAHSLGEADIAKERGHSLRVRIKKMSLERPMGGITLKIRVKVVT